MELDLPPPRRKWRIFWVTALFGLPIAVFGYYTYQNWRCDQMLQEAKAAVIAAGETLDLKQLLPPPIPREDNFCATPALDGIADPADSGPAEEKMQRLKNLFNGPGKVDSNSCLKLRSLSLDEKIDWSLARTLAKKAGFAVPEEETNPTRAVLRALEVHEPLFKELAEAAERCSQAQYLPRLDQQRISSRGVCNPQYGAVSRLAAYCLLVGRGAVATGQRDRAKQAWTICYRLQQGQEASLELFGIFIGVSSSAKILMEGLQARIWECSDLARFQSLSEQQSLEAPFLQGLRAAMLEGDYKELARALTMSAPDLKGYILYLRPTEWAKGNQAQLFHWFLDRQIIPMKRGGVAGYVRASKGADAELLRCGLRRDAADHYISTCLVPDAHFPFLEMRRRQLILACALERHFLQHQSYPQALAELVPAFLAAVPEDLDKQPMRYAPDQRNGRFRLWSIGVDLKDDWHGVAPASVKRIINSVNLDWILSFPQTPPP